MSGDFVRLSLRVVGNSRRRRRRREEKAEAFGFDSSSSIIFFKFIYLSPLFLDFFGNYD